MQNLLKAAFFVWAFSGLCQTASGGMIYNVTLDTAQLVGHPAGPFYIELTFTDGSGVEDANNTVRLSNLNFGGGSALGGALLFGGASGSLETGVTIADSSVLSLFTEQFAPGLLLSFSLGLTSNDDAGDTPDGFTFFVLDSSGVAIPTLAPFGDYFFGADLGSSGPIFDAYGSDPNRALSAGNPVSISAPTIASIDSVPELSTKYLLGAALFVIVALKRLVPDSVRRTRTNLQRR
jgi:hypothetical protein